MPKYDNENCEAKYEMIKTKCYATLREVFASGNYEFLKHNCCATLKTTSDECIKLIFNEHPFKDAFKPESARFGHLCKQHCMTIPDPEMMV